MQPRRRPHGRLLVALLVLAAAVVVVVRVSGGTPDPANTPTDAPDGSRPPLSHAHAERPVAVLAAIVTWADESREAPLRATGTLTPQRRAEIAFPVEGVVDRVSADEGDRIAAGDPLAALDVVPFDAAVAEARARATFLATRAARSDELFREGALSEEERHADAAEHEAIDAALKLQTWRRARAVLRAPFDGTVLERRIERGQVVGPGAAAYVVLDVDSLELTVSIAARDLRDVDLSRPARVHVHDLGIEVTATLEHEPVAGDSRAASVPVVFDVPNGSGALYAGLVADVEIPRHDGVRGGLGTARATMVPVTALDAASSSDDARVFRVTGEIVKAISVTVGALRGDRVEILSGLVAGDRVVVHAPDRLRDGARVLVTTTDDTPTDARSSS